MSCNLVLPIWKPIQWTSYDVVKKIKNIIKINKVGHAGTLDPFAEGVLIICTGKKTSDVEKYMNLKKEYKGIINIGCRTDTLDTESPINQFKEINNVTLEKLNIVKDDFIGCINQIPPQYSAIKYKGKPLYKYARKNIRVCIPPRKVDVYDFQINSFNENKINFTITCGRGTYIRSIARDVGLKLDSFGYLTKLKRTKIGKFDINNSIKIEKLEEWLSTRV